MADVVIWEKVIKKMVSQNDMLFDVALHDRDKQEKKELTGIANNKRCLFLWAKVQYVQVIIPGLWRSSSCLNGFLDYRQR